MRLVQCLLPGLLLLAGTTITFGQSTTPLSTEPVEPASQKTLFKLGVNPGRLLQGTRLRFYDGAVLPISLGVEHMLNDKFSVYGQLDADFGFYRYRSALSPDIETKVFIPTGALGVGARYYYNQAGRAAHNRAHGAFNGNYLALEAHTEARRFGYSSTPASYAPSLNAVWGMQRRLGRHFLFDLNAGVGFGRAFQTGESYPARTTLTTQLNLGIYFGH
jgi:hypothetical protein